MKKFFVEYDGGQSRYSDCGIDYMLADVDGVELYAEAEPHEDDETGTYDELKAAILEQAAENGIAAESLKFWFDEE